MWFGSGIGDISIIRRPFLFWSILPPRFKSVHHFAPAQQAAADAAPPGFTAEKGGHQSTTHGSNERAGLETPPSIMSAQLYGCFITIEEVTRKNQVKQRPQNIE